MTADRQSRKPPRAGRPGKRRNARGSRRGRDERAAPEATIPGSHAVEALLRHAPGRILALHLWSRDRRLRERLEELARAAGVRTLDSPPDDGSAADPRARGAAARVRPYAYASLDDLIGRPDPLLLLLDSITDARNLGAILRSAAFFAADGVVLPTDRACGVTPTVERISRGATATLRIARVTNLARAVRAVQQAGIPCAATVIREDAMPMSPSALAPPLAIVLGGEHKGVRRLVAERCERRLVLPSNGPMQSLNVASFASIALAFARAR